MTTYLRVVESWDEPGRWVAFWMNSASLACADPCPLRACWLAIRARMEEA